MGKIYLYGMILSTNSLLLDGVYPEPDGYCEFKKRYFHLGGETGAAAAILASLGCELVLGGTHLGTDNNELIRNYFADKNVDMSGIVYNENFRGVTDFVIIDKETRTCFGEFGKLYSGSDKWYEAPNEEAIKQCSIVGADSFFGDEFALLCKKHSKKYATIDSMHDSVITRECAVIAISHEFLNWKYPDINYEELMTLYTENTDGLVIFTIGSKGAMYSRKGGEIKYCPAFAIDTVSTLGAGDSFKAGTIYGLSVGMGDDELVRFACATAACACMNYPIPLNPPTHEKINKLIKEARYATAK